MENVKVECCESENSEVVERILEDAYCDYQDEELSNTNDSNAPGSSVRDNENEESELCDDDSKAIIEQLIDDKGKIWDRKYIINSGVEGTVSDCNVKIEIDAIEEKPFFDETESSIVDSKTFTKQLIDERGIWKTESGTSQEDWVKVEPNEEIQEDSGDNSSAEANTFDELITTNNIIDDTRNVPQKKSHQCRLCDYATNRKVNLTRHVDAVHLNVKNHKCEICEYTTSKKYNVKVHVDNVHLKIKNHKCHMCDYTTSKRRNLKPHIDSVHLKKKNIECSFCDYTTFWRFNLKAHMQRVHLKVKIPKKKSGRNKR